MSSALDEEEDLDSVGDHDREHSRYEHGDYDGDDREITLNSTTLLAIFFGLVLVCGLFFGLGFTVGKRSSRGETDAGLSTPKAAKTSASSPDSSDYLTKPSASSQTVAPPQPTVKELPVQTTVSKNTSDVGSDAPDVEAKPAPRAPVVKPAFTPAAVSAPATAAVAAPAVAPALGSYMVQIAAVSNPADSAVLVRALGKHGYTASVRHEPKDALLHVQVGPFSSKAEAVAMRQKLLSDGYNAILK